jgi:hypothetical protein
MTVALSLAVRHTGYNGAAEGSFSLEFSRQSLMVVQTLFTNSFYRFPAMKANSRRALRR